MKTNTLKILFFILALFLFSFATFAQDFKKVPDKKISQEEVNTGKQFIEDFFAAVSTGSHYDFGSNATEQVKSMFSPDMQKTVYQQLKDQFGEYQSAEYVEAWEQSANSAFKILRYKGQFSEASQKMEIRVVLDGANKIAGFFVKPWSDSFN